MMRKGSECDGKERRLRHKNRIVLEEACLGIEYSSTERN